MKSTTVIAQLNASYEIDFWGKNRATVYAAIANQLASSFDAATTAISTDASIATTYLNAVATQKQIDIAKNNQAIAQKTLNAILERQKFGTASGLDVAQQQTLVYNVQVTIPPLERQLEQYKHALAVLVGTAPEEFHYKGDDLYKIAVPTIPAGLPSELLAAGRTSPITKRFSLPRSSQPPQPAPRSFRRSSSTVAPAVSKAWRWASLFQPQSLFYNAAVGITQPLTDLYRLQAIVDQDRARYGELLDNYRQAIISAFQNVEDALIAVQKNAEQERAQRLAVQSARKAYEISQTQLQGGIIDVTTLLQVQQTLFTAENALALVRQSRLQAAVTLYQALGGGWYKPGDSAIAEVPSILEIKARTP